jgi:hypothetical protein
MTYAREITEKDQFGRYTSVHAEESTVDEGSEGKGAEGFYARVVYSWGVLV